MGFFKKIFKGIGKFFKKVGRGIKKTFKKFGKFMDKIGIVGQIAMMFILPHVGGMLLEGIGSAAQWAGAKILGTTAAQTGTGFLSSLVRGAGHVIRGAGKFASNLGAKFTSVGEGMLEFGKTTVNALTPGQVFPDAAPNFFGANGAWGRAVTSWQATPGLFEGILPTAGKVATATAETATEGLMDFVVEANPGWSTNIPTTSETITMADLTAKQAASVENLAALAGPPAAETAGQSIFSKGADLLGETAMDKAKNTAAIVQAGRSLLGGPPDLIESDFSDIGRGAIPSYTPIEPYTPKDNMDVGLLNDYAVQATVANSNPNLFGGGSLMPGDPTWAEWLKNNPIWAEYFKNQPNQPNYVTG